MLLLNLKDILFVYLCFAYRKVKRMHTRNNMCPIHVYILLLFEDQSDHVEFPRKHELYTITKLLLIFTYCTIDVKNRLFRYYCSSLWYNCTKKIVKNSVCIKFLNCFRLQDC